MRCSRLSTFCAVPREPHVVAGFLREEHLVAGRDAFDLGADGGDDAAAALRLGARRQDQPGARLGLLVGGLDDDEVVERLEREPRWDADLPTRNPQYSCVMAESPFVELEVGKRIVKVTNPDKVFFPRARRDEARPRPVLHRGRRRHRAGALRAPDAAEAAPGRRRGRGDLPEARARSTGPTGSRPRRVTFPSGRHADELCVTELAQVVWAANLATIDFHPWPSRRARRRAPGRAPHRRRSAARHRLRRGEAGRGDRAGRRSTRSATSAGRRRRATAASTSPAGSSRSGASARCAAARSRSRARSSGARRSSSRPRGGRRSAASASSSTTTRTPATGRSPPPTRSAARPDATVSAPFALGGARPTLETEDFTLATMPRRFAELGDVHAGIDDAVCDLRVLLRVGGARGGGGSRRGAVSAELPEDAGRAEARAAVAREEGIGSAA